MSNLKHRWIATLSAFFVAAEFLACRTVPEAVEPPEPMPAAASAAASTRSLPNVDVRAQQAPSIDPNASSGAGTLLIYSSTAGHIPYREVTREGVLYRGKTKEEREATRGASIEAEIADAVKRHEGVDADSGEGPDLSPPDLEGRPHVPRIAPLAPSADVTTAVLLRAERVRIVEGRWGNKVAFEVMRRDIDLDQNGLVDETRYLDTTDGHLIRAERDANADGRVDAWDIYDGSGLARRKRDSDGDGHADVWEEYAHGRLTAVRLDRDHDGSIDAVYRYEGISLVEERYDSDADGKIDIVFSYVNRVLVKTQEDRNRDGQTDTWTTYRLIDGEEVVARVDRDRNGDGNADVRKVYQRQGESQGEYDDLSPL